MKEKIQSVNGAFHRYHCNHRNIVDSRFREKGIYFGQPPILKYLSEHKNVTQKEIAEHLHVSAPSVATSLKRMEESGLVVRVEDKKDARRNTVILTKKGKELVKYTDDTFMCINAVTFNGFTEEEMDTLVKYLERMNENITSFAKEDDHV